MQTNVRSLSSAGRRKTKEVKGHRVLPNTKDESPRVVKGRESRLVTNAKPKEEKADRKTTSKTSDKPSKNANQQPQARASKASSVINSKKNSSTIAKPGATNALADEQKKPVLNTEAGVITQSELRTIIESLRGGDASLLRGIAAMTSGNDNSGSSMNDENTRPSLTTFSDLHDSNKDQAPLSGILPYSSMYDTYETVLVNRLYVVCVMI